MTILILTCTESLCFIETTSNKMPFGDNVSVSNLLDEFYRNMSTESYGQLNIYSTRASTQKPLLPNKGWKDNKLSSHLSDIDTKRVPIENDIDGKLATRQPFKTTFSQSKSLAHIKTNKNDKYANGCLDFLELKQDLDLNHTDCLGPICCSSFHTGNSVDSELFNSSTQSVNSNASSVNYLPSLPTELSNESKDQWARHHRNNPDGLENTIIHIGGLFELSGSRSDRLGLSELSSAKLAVEHVNRANFLHGYTLNLLHNDTRVSIQSF